MNIQIKDELMKCMVRKTEVNQYRSASPDKPIEDDIVIRFYWKVTNECFNVVVSNVNDIHRPDMQYIHASKIAVPQYWTNEAVRVALQNIDSIVKPHAEQWSKLIPQHLWKNFHPETQTLLFFHNPEPEEVATYAFNPFNWR